AAAFHYFKVDSSQPDAQRLLLLECLRRLFPAAFTMVDEERKSLAGAKTKWTTTQKLDLVIFFNDRIRAGATQEEAGAAAKGPFSGSAVQGTSLVKLFIKFREEFRKMGISDIYSADFQK